MELEEEVKELRLEIEKLKVLYKQLKCSHKWIDNSLRCDEQIRFCGKCKLREEKNYQRDGKWGEWCEVE